MIVLENISVVYPTHVITHQDVIVEEHRIVDVRDHKGGVYSSHTQRIDGTHLLVSAGWIDLQVNGGFGRDFTVDPSTIWEVAARLPSLGITAFLPTIITSPEEVREEALRVWRSGPPEGWCGAIPLGLHFEGPFLSVEKRGAHPVEYLRMPDVGVVEGWARDWGVWLVTAAVELEGFEDVANCLHEQNVTLSIGHTNATWEEAMTAFEKGVTYGTHLFNAMRGFHHREPGAVGALLARQDIAVGMIVDGIHVHPGAVRLAWQCKSPQTVTLVTDACAGLGMPPGRYRLGAMEIIVSEDRATLPNGTLAGSIVTPAQALRNLIQFTGCDLSEAIDTVTRAPARVVQLQDPVIMSGREANLTIFTPDLEVIYTIVGGRVVFGD